MTALDDRAWTDEERRQAADEVYGRNAALHRTALQRQIEDAEWQRQVEHRNQLDYGLVRLAAMPPVDSPGWLTQALDLLVSLHLAHEATDTRHADFMAAAMVRLDSLEVS